MSEQAPKNEKQVAPLNMLKSIDDFFQQSFSRSPLHSLFDQPIPIKVEDLEDGFFVKAQLPGIHKSQIELNVYHHAVQIIIYQDKAISSTHNHYEKRERTIGVPFLIDYEHVQAQYQNGLLTIKLLPKKKAIQIKT